MGPFKSIVIQAGETDLNKRIDREKFTYYRPKNTFVKIICIEML